MFELNEKPTGQGMRIAIVAARFNRVRQEALCQHRDERALARELVEMRHRMMREHGIKDFLLAKKKAARDKIMATKTDKRGLVIVHTGKGKGKRLPL